MSYKKYTDPRARATRDRTTFYRHYLNLSDIEEDIEKSVLNKFMQLMDNADLDDFLYGRKEFLNAVNETIVSEIGFYSKILLVNQNVGFLEKINSIIRERLRATLVTKTEIPLAQIDLILTFAVAGRTAVYRRWIINGFKPSAEVVSEMLEKISSSGFDYFLVDGKDE